MAKVVTIKWRGETYTLNEEEVFLAADAIEDVLTIGELSRMLSSPRDIRFVKVAKCYAAMLKEAGASVTAREVHSEFMKAKNGSNGTELRLVAMQSCTMLLEILMDGAPMSKEGGEQQNPPSSGSSDGPSEEASESTE
jgi:uncharacterized protein YerC